MVTPFAPPPGPPPAAPFGIKPEILSGPDVLRQQIVTSNGYMWSQMQVLSHLVDEVESEVGPETFERMSLDPKIHKTDRIIVNGTLTDDLVFAAGATEEEAQNEEEYGKYEQVMQFAERIIAGLDAPIWHTLEQMLTGAREQGHKIAEVYYDFKQDAPTKSLAGQLRSKPTPKPRSALSRLFNLKAQEPEVKPRVRGQKITNRPKTRLMPTTLRVLPRGAALFVVNQYRDVLGLVPAWRYGEGRMSSVYHPNQIITRDKFLVYTNNPKDDDPRGFSDRRPIVNLWNFVNKIPTEYLRYLVQEGLPIPVMTLPQQIEGWIPVYETQADGTKTPKLDPTTQKPIYVDIYTAARMTVEDMRNGKGVVVPFGTVVAPYTGKGAAGDAIFPNALKTIYQLMEEAVLLQPLAQSAGDVQSKSAAQVHMGILGDHFFWYKRKLALMLLYDLIAVCVRYNLGDWALSYMPKASFGDSEKRVWAEDLEVIAKAYFYGFIDDTQRAELMSWLGLPKAGPSRQAILAEQDPTTGEPRVPNKNRPDKRPENINRNDGNSTEKENANASLLVTNLSSLGNIMGRRSTFVQYLRPRPSKKHTGPTSH